MIALAVWLAALPLRLLGWLGLRGSVILACLAVLAVTAYGAAGELGLLDPPAHAAPRRPRAPADRAGRCRCTATSPPRRRSSTPTWL